MSSWTSSPALTTPAHSLSVLLYAMQMLLQAKHPIDGVDIMDFVQLQRRKN